MKYTKEEKEAIRKSFNDAEDRILTKIKERMIVLSKDKKLKKQMLKEIQDKLSTS